jgi:hypothetical protein
MITDMFIGRALYMRTTAMLVVTSNYPVSRYRHILAMAQNRYETRQRLKTY